MLCRKGAIAVDKTTLIIYTLIGFAIILLFVLGFAGQGDTLENWACRASVYYSSQTGGDKTPSFFDLNPILCRTHYKKMKNNEDLANGMITAWKIFGEGNPGGPTGTNWLLWQQTRCFKKIRGEVMDELAGVNKNEFIKYLKETKLKNTDESYYNYFNSGDLDRNRVIILFDELEKGDFIGVYYFEEVETVALNPFGIGYNLAEIIFGDNEDQIVVTRDNGGEGLRCTEIE